MSRKILVLVVSVVTALVLVVPIAQAVPVDPIGDGSPYGPQPTRTSTGHKGKKTTKKSKKRSNSPARNCNRQLQGCVVG